VSAFKDWLQSDQVQEAINWLLAKYVSFVHRTGRWEFVHKEYMDQATSMLGSDEGKQHDGPMIFAFWHGRLPLMWAVTDRPGLVNVLISEHRDGRLIARIMERLGLKVVTGSTSRGGAKALLQMVRFLKNGERIGITPDGPRGPRMHAQMGVIALAQRSGAPILPLSLSAKSCRFLGSWDRMQIPNPFTKGMFIFAEPMIVPKDAKDLEPYRLQLEKTLNDLTAEADRRMGQTPVLQADEQEVVATLKKLAAKAEKQAKREAVEQGQGDQS